MTDIVGIKILGEYEMSLDDIDGSDWMAERLAQAARGGEIADYNVLTSLTDATGTQLVLFIVDKAFGWSFSADQSHADAMHSAANLLSDVLGNTGATVRWLAPLEV